MVMSLEQMIFLGIPEGISIAIIAFILSNVKLEWKKVILIGIVLPFITFLIRLLPITFGVHTIIYIGLLFFLLYSLGKVPLITAITNSLITLLLVIIYETSTTSIIMNLFDISQEMVLENIFLYMIVFYPHVLLLLFTAFLINKKRGKKINYVYKN